MKVILKKEKRTIPTYVPGKAEELPMFFENRPYQGASGKVYPIPYSDSVSDTCEDVKYDVYTLENEYVKTDVLPEIGGKILRGYDKIGSYDFIYYNEVIKPALVGLAGPWISGGIEFNWPQHHRPTTYMPLEASVEEGADGSKTVWVGEVEPMNRMKGMAGITVCPGRSFIKAKMKVYNRTSLPQTFMWWANLAAPANKDYRTIFPPDVEWVNDHDRRATLSWPIAKGIYKTARPFNYGEGTDISRYDSVRVPSSFLISQGQSDMDFVAGYDEGINKGIVTVADHHISPGKKLWHWGIGDFGDMWCSNLTDKNGPYIELMTGVYTDNQPDFTWLAPYESREFEQYWYPIRDIGDVKNATIDAAVNLEKRGDEIFIGFNVTGSFENATILVKDKNGEIYRENADLTPDKAYVKTIPAGDTDMNGVTVSLISCEGKTLVSYTPYVRGQKQPIEVRKPVARPCEIATVEELYINGYHLEQYKQHNYRPEDYYLEGLARDEGDIRCNTSMARLSYRKGEFEKCIAYADKAIARLTSRNQHPTDTEAFYLKGLALKDLSRSSEAYDTLFRAGWNYSHRASAYLELASIDCADGRYADALEKLETVLSLGKHNSVALGLKAAILRKLSKNAEAKAIAEDAHAYDLLDLRAIFELSHFEDMTDTIAYFAEKAENIIDIAAEYISEGLLDDALYTLDFAPQSYPLVSYYRAYTLSLMGRDNTSEIEKAEACHHGYCFPNRISDIIVLESVISSCKKSANASYYLGCLFYNKERYDDAISAWERCVSVNPEKAEAYRNLALAYFDKRGNAEKAKVCMKTALDTKKTSPRMLMEYQQLLKNTNTSPEERLAVYEEYPELFAKRDDCYLDKVILLTLMGKYKESIELAAAKRFHIYEGGEGRLTKQHSWMFLLYALKLENEGLTDESEEYFKRATIIPKSYGEAKTFFNQEAHIYFYLGQMLEKLGRADDALKAFEEASIYKAAVSELSAFRALALRKLGRESEADDVTSEMLAVADERITNSDLRTYYGVGSPSPMPFENNIVKNNLLSGYILKAFALRANGDSEGADKYIALAEEISPFAFEVHAYRAIFTK
ncbi:MAG: DUF5107 domain-containing protein [Clostridia bacterium]|nr:DUF5107 domain-containing protein [Clostridia bacterium]